MHWTRPKDLRAQVQKLWDKGELLRPLVQGQVFIPLRLRLRLTGPTSAELSQHFDEVRAWAAELRTMPRVRLSAKRVCSKLSSRSLANID